MLVRANERGEEIWITSFGGDGVDRSNSVIELDDGGFALGGSTTSFGQGGYDFWLIRTDDEGEDLWSTINGGADRDMGAEVISTFDKGYAFAGQTQSYGHGAFDMWLLRTKPDPDLLPFWRMTLPDTSVFEDESLSIAMSYFSEMTFHPGIEDSLIDITILGGDFSEVAIENDTVNISTDQNWNGVDEMMFIISAPDRNSDTTYRDLTVLPTNDLPEAFSLLSPEDGFAVSSWITDLQWQTASQNEWESDTVSYTLQLMCMDRGYEGGYEIENLADTVYAGLEMTTLEEWMELDLGAQEFHIDWWVEAVDDSDMTESSEVFTFTIPVESAGGDQHSEIPTEFVLYPAFPNPFNSTTTVTFDIPSKSLISLQVYNHLGEKVNTVFNEILRAGVHQAEISLESYPSGLYFVKLSSQKTEHLCKIVLLK